MIHISIISEIYEVYHQKGQMNSDGEKTSVHTYTHTHTYTPAWPFEQLAENQIYESANECISRSMRRNNAFITAKI